MGSKKIDDLSVQISADASGFAAGLRQPIVDLNKFKRDAERIAADVGGMKSSAKEFAAHKRMAKESASAWKEMASIAQVAMAGVVTGGTAAAGLVAMELGINSVTEAWGHLRDSVKMAADFEQTQINFETLIGSAKEAAQVMTDLRKFAAETPFSSKDVTEGAKQMLAFGVSARDLIPVLKTIGTISAGGGTSLKDEIYRWGTVRVAGRAQQQDINQYTTAGHDVYPGIAKALGVEMSEVRKHIEDGRVGVNELNASLEGLANVKYAGLLQRQAESLKGSWEQMTDAFDRAKLKLGQNIVRELGLKGATKDAEGFANRLERFVDGPFVTGGIRLFGEFGRAIANLASEFGKGAFDGVSIFGEMAKNVPVVKELAESTSRILKDMQEYRIDPVTVAEFATVASDQILSVGGAIVDAIVRGGKALNEKVLSPMMKTAKEVGDLIAAADAAKTRAENIRDFFDAGKQAEKIYNYWLDSTDPRRAAQVWSGGDQRPKAPDHHIGDDLQDATNEFGNFFRDMIASAKELRQHGKDIVRRIKEEQQNAQFEAKMAAYQPEYDAMMAQARAGVSFRKQYMELGNQKPLGVGALSALNPIDPLSGLAASAAAFRRELDSLGGKFGSGSILEGVLKSAGYLGLPGSTGLSAHQMDMSRRIKEDFDPMLKLNRDLKQFEDLFKAGGLTKEEFEFARQKEVRGVADSLGIGGPTKLPEAAMRDSAESVRIINQWQAGSQTQTVEDLIRQVINRLDRNNTQNDTMIHKTGSNVVVSIPR